LLYFTGSKEHNVALRGRANEMGYTLNEYELATLGEGKRARKKATPREKSARLRRRPLRKTEKASPRARDGGWRGGRRRRFTGS